MFEKAPWLHEVTARDLLAHGTAEKRLSVVGLVRFDEVLKRRDRRGLDPAMSRQLIEMHRRWMEERFGTEDLVPAFVRCEALRGVSEVRLDCNWLGEEGMTEVLASPLLHHVEELEVAAGMHGIDGYAALHELRALRRFALSRPDDQDGDHLLGDDLAALLVEARFPQLEELTLPRTSVGPAGLTALLGLPHLHHLDLDGTRIGDAGLDAIAGATRLPHVKRLGLGECLAYDEKRELVGQSEALVRLLTSPALSPEGLDLGGLPGAAAVVARSPRMTTLVDLTTCDVDGDQLAALLASPHLGAVRRLRLDHCHLSSEELASFGRSPLLAKLEQLVLGNDLLASQEGLLAAPLPALRTLSLEGNHTTAAALTRARLPALTELRLELTAMQLSQDDEVAEADPDDIVDALVTATGLPALRRVVVSFVSEEAKEKLEARFAEVR